MPSVSAFASSSSALLRGPPARVRRLLVAAATRAHSSAAGGGSRARGGLPRFHTPSIPSSKGEVVRIQGDEFWHMTRVLRLGVNDRVDLFDGAGGLVEGSITKVDKGGSDVELLEDARLIAPQGIQWHVFAAFGTLKGGRADWLIEKCTVCYLQFGCSASSLCTSKSVPLF
ncbi:uncharacterized protein LOC120692861 [Panicum virgatum]|uniref:uncharacterized protein LOC120692861 n=1 Tax=Panicum virgatum TaxID=38727 RepID=UPI0019D5DA45|nr:uncharacterized protein LOC120692861 [Panicum virgatum]